MYDTLLRANANAPHGAMQQRLRASWWILALAGVAVLGLAISIQPRSAAVTRSGKPLSTPVTAGADPTEASQPPPVSLTDVIGKASLGLLVVYAVGWALVRMRRSGWSPRLAIMGPEDLPRPLPIAESLPLGHQQATLHLVEVDGTALLLGSHVDQVSVLWTSPAVPPVAPPVTSPAEGAVVQALSRVAPPASERKPLGERPVRREADWEQERSRLIRSLVSHDEIA